MKLLNSSRLNVKLSKIELATKELSELSNCRKSLLKELQEISVLLRCHSNNLQVLQVGENKVAHLLAVVEISNKKALELNSLVQEYSKLQEMPRIQQLLAQFHHIIQYVID